MGATVVKRALDVEAAGPNLLRSEAWTGWDDGFDRIGAELLCDNGIASDVQRGAGQTVILDQTVPVPVVASAWSKAESVSGGRDSDYSLYLDVVYTDGEPKWGQIATFRTGSHDWERKEVLFVPEKAIRQISYYVLLRRHAGKAWFRDMELHELRVPDGVVVFDGVPVAPGRIPPRGFQLRDVAAETDFVSFDDGAAFEADLSVSSREEQGTIFVEAELRDTSGRDRALTLVYAIRLPERQWQWLPDARHAVATESNREYTDTNRCRAGVGGRLSKLPMAAVASTAEGRAIAVDLFTPAVHRAGYNASTRELFLSFDVGLTPERPTATVRFCYFSFAPEWGFRAALAKLYRIFPKAFLCRVPNQGLWMPFARISKVQGWEDFGFAIKEGNNETKWDDAHGIATFRYTEPMTWWMKMLPETPRDVATAVRQARALAAAQKQERAAQQARAWLASSFHDEYGSFPARMLDTPWCDGAVWSMNSMPGIKGDVTDYTLKWNASIRDKLYGPARDGDLDGEYVDSSEGYVTDELDFRRDHFGAVDTPLTFDSATLKPAIFRGLIAFEYIRALAVDVHGMGKLMMANSTPSRIWWLAPQLDVLGSETNWNPGGKWRPMSDRELLYRRSLCGPKPYCFLMNTAFEQFPYERVEKYMKRCLAYGMFPGFFSHNASQGHYFTRPEIYNRDRALFRTYVPLCKTVAEAGWQPVTQARANLDHVYLERFGDRFLTAFNDGDERCEVTIVLDRLRTGKSRELLSGVSVSWTKMVDGRQSTTLSLGPEDVAVLALR